MIPINSNEPKIAGTIIAAKACKTITDELSTAKIVFGPFIKAFLMSVVELLFGDKKSIVKFAITLP